MPDLPPPAGLPAPLPLPPGGAALPPLPGLPTPGEVPVPARYQCLRRTCRFQQLRTDSLTGERPVDDALRHCERERYNELWAKRSEKPLQQIYGHIDRISNKEAGSLLVDTPTALAIPLTEKSS